MTLQTFLQTIEALFIVCAGFGALYSFIRARKDETVKIQSSTIVALQQQLDVISKKLDMLEKENTRLNQMIETIQSALKQKGIHVTIDGDMVIIEEKEHKTSVVRRPRPAGAPEQE